MNYYNITNIGKRKNNQDQVYITQNSGNQILALVCDGMGGHNSGDLASKVACEYIVDCFKIMPVFASKEEATKWLDSAILKAHDITKRLSKTSSVHDGMGTTVVVVLVLESSYLVSSVGDSRCYFIDNSTIEQQTEDDTFVNELIKSGIITPSEAKNHPKRNVLMKAIGVSDDINPKTAVYPLRPGYIVLCSDGLYNSVDSTQLLEVMQTKASLKDKLEALVTLALEQGANDNVTIAAIEVDGGDVDGK